MSSQMFSGEVDPGFSHFREMEREEISRLKWLISEKNRADCGWEYAEWCWIMHGHRDRWIAEMAARSQPA